MNYLNHYNLLIERARTRITTGYKEAHHIIPRCLGGNNDPSNLVDLTAREHYIAHIFLAKIHGGTLWHAVNLMGRLKRYSNRHYEKARIEHSKLLSAQNKRTKTKPKETRHYQCSECSMLFNKIEFCHHPIRENPFCSQGCAASSNGRASGLRRKGMVLAHLHGRKTWNKGLPNPTSADNGKKGAAKMAAIAKGRTRLYREDGSWTWQYPK